MLRSDIVSTDMPNGTLRRELLIRTHQLGQVLQSSKLGQASKCAIVPDEASIDPLNGARGGAHRANLLTTLSCNAHLAWAKNPFKHKPDYMHK